MTEINSLSEFLLATPNTIEEEIVVSTRFKTTDGQILKFKIKSVTPAQYDEYKKICFTHGKKGKVTFDQGKLDELLIINHTITPNFRDAELIQKSGCATPAQLMQKSLLAGEAYTLSNAISALSGFDSDVEDLVEEVKN